MSQLFAVIMAGGSGTRFWPASRKMRPKQLLPLAGRESLLRQTIARVAPMCGLERVLVATGAHLAAATLADVPELSAEQLLIEPCPRNTAPCIGWAAARVARNHPEAVIMALPADAFVRDAARFQECLHAAVRSAEGGVITTVGITPTHPETGYGYIEAEPGDGAVRGVVRFIEKPSVERAVEFVTSGNFFWNAGMFFFRACDMLDAVAAHLPELAAGLGALDAAAARDREAEALAEIFPKLPAISIDHGVMEKMKRLAVVPGDFGWSDLGSWLAVSDLADKDAQGNSAPPGAILVAAQGNHVHGDRRLVALVGVSDLVVVDTDDALLVVHKHAAQRVRDVVAALEARGDDRLV
jgi:mannose-1-phosphate guanylyltransferase